MKRNEYRLLVESWREVLKEDDSKDDDSKDDDLYAPIEEPDQLEPDQLEPDQLTRDMDYVEDQIDEFKEKDTERADMLQKFCKMMGISCSEEDIGTFLADQMFDSGYDIEGKEFDSDQTPDDMTLADYSGDDDLV